MAKYNVVFVLGGPGAGKGTQCERIVQKYGYTHLSAGDLLRAERQTKGSKVGELIEEHIRNGTIVPVEITCGLLEKAMKATQSGDSNKNDFLIDGFPRNLDNQQGWEREMATKTNLQFVLFFDCTEQTCIDRCLSRGAAGSGRSDDNIESLKKRIKTYHESTMPIIDHYDKQGLVRKMDAGKGVEEVFADVQEVFDAIKK